MLSFNILASENPLDHVVQHELFRIGDFVVSNHVLMVLLAAILMLIILPRAARRDGLVPKGLANLIESICLYLREEVARPALKEHTDKFIKYLWTLFFFILFCNLIGMIPLAGIVYFLSGTKLSNIGGTATANIWITGTLAMVSFFMIHICGIRQQGIASYMKHFIPPVPWPLVPLMFVLEFIAALIKPFALAIRLFANMVAGHTVIAALLSLIFMAKSYSVGAVTVAGCAALSILELFTAVLQAYIFVFLTTLFISAAIEPEH